MGLFDFLKVTVVEKTATPKYTAILKVDGKQLAVANLGIESVTATGAGKLAVGQTVAFDLTLKDPKDNLALRGSGKVLSADKGQVRIGFGELSAAQRQSVAKFLARYMMAR